MVLLGAAFHPEVAAFIPCSTFQMPPDSPHPPNTRSFNLPASEPFPSSALTLDTKEELCLLLPEACCCPCPPDHVLFVSAIDPPFMPASLIIFPFWQTIPPRYKYSTFSQLNTHTYTHTHTHTRLSLQLSYSILTPLYSAPLNLIKVICVFHVVESQWLVLSLPQFSSCLMHPTPCLFPTALAL